jgi:uncharacterized protein (TIGR03000 family)
MFVVRTARVLGLAAAMMFLAAGFSATATAQKDGKKVKSKLKITVPQDDAELLIEGQATKPTGEVREFETPELDSGKLYVYTFTVKWEPNNYTKMTREKTVEFKSGDDVRCGFQDRQGGDSVGADARRHCR